DDHHRWSLWYYGDGSPVPLVRGAEIVVWVGDQPLTLAELEDSTVGNRRPPGGDAVVVRGRVAGVWVEAELLTAGGASTPQASVTVTVFPDRYLPTVRGVRFFQLPHAETLAGDGPLVALGKGGHSAPKATPRACACASIRRATAWRLCAPCSCPPRPSIRSASHRP